MGKFYWLKLKKDFFKRHDIRIIEDKQDGGKMVLFYLKLLCESVDHDGKLRFSEEIPYDNDMLSSVTNTDREIVDETMEILKKLGMVKVEEDGTINMNGVDSMLGSDTTWAEKKRQYRDKLMAEEGQFEDNSRTIRGQFEDKPRTNRGQTEDNSRTIRGQKEDMSDKSKSKRKSKSIEIELEKEEEIDNDKSLSLSSKAREIPKKDEVIRFAHSQKIDRFIDADQFWNFYNDQDWKIKGEDIQDWKSLLMKWANNVKDRKNVVEIPIMENEYSSEHLKAKEEESLQKLDELLKDGE